MLKLVPEGIKVNVEVVPSYPHAQAPKEIRPAHSGRRVKYILPDECTPLFPLSVYDSCRGESAEEAQMRHGGGKASGSVDLAFDANENGLSEGSEAVTVSVDASASEVQTALRALGGLLQEVEVSVDAGAQRARNGGEPLRRW